MSRPLYYTFKNDSLLILNTNDKLAVKTILFIFRYTSKIQSDFYTLLLSITIWVTKNFRLMVPDDLSIKLKTWISSFLLCPPITTSKILLMSYPRTKLFMHELSNHQECRLCSPDDDEDADGADDDANSIGTVDDESSSVLCLDCIVCVLCRGSSKENILLKNSYDVKKIAP